MSERKQIVLTGITGFLGSHLGYSLLQQGHHLTALARGATGAPAQSRVLQALNDVASGEDVRPLLSQLTVIEADVAQPGFGMTDAGGERLASETEEVWHCAASLSFVEEDRDAIFRSNLDGTRNVIEFAHRTAGKRLHHTSTAYIAGRRTGVVLESETFVGQKFKNPYEESKCQAELLVEAAQREGLLRATTYRPSIVIGDSRTGRSTHFHGVYGFLRGLWAAVRRLKRSAGLNDLVTFPLRVLGSEGSTLNFVPIDYVVGGMTAIGNHPSSIGRTYHLANPHPTPNTFWLETISAMLGVQGIQLVGESTFLKDPMTALESLFHRKMAFYYQYLGAEPIFDCSNTLAAIRETGLECPAVTTEFVHRMVGWYFDHLEAERQAPN